MSNKEKTDENNDKDLNEVMKKCCPEGVTDQIKLTTVNGKQNLGKRTREMIAETFTPKKQRINNVVKVQSSKALSPQFQELKDAQKLHGIPLMHAYFIANGGDPDKIGY